MKTVILSDRTLALKAGELSFKEKLELARSLGNLQLDGIEFGRIQNPRVDVLLVRTVSAFVKKSVLCVNVGTTLDGVEKAAEALSVAEKARLQVSLPVSAVCMEYECHRKPPKMLELITALVTASKEKCADVEFCAVDATRAEPEFLLSAVQTAAAAGATGITLCDTAGETMPDELASFVRTVAEKTNIPVAVSVNDKNGLAAAGAVLALKAGASSVKTVLTGEEEVPFATVARLIKNCGGTQGLSCSIKQTELGRALSQTDWILGKNKNDKPMTAGEKESTSLDASAEPVTVAELVKGLGYDLSDEDNAKVYEEFKRVAAKKSVTAKELDAIVAAVALQVPPTYQLQSYVVNNGNIITASAQISLVKNGETLTGINMGDGPVDAAFRTIDQIIGRHYELDDFSIRSVTEGREAVGSAIVRLRAGGKLYSGNGISTDIIGAAIRAYLGAINKIVYEEN